MSLESRQKIAIMGNKLCPKIILEGTRLTFKTEIAFTLNELTAHQRDYPFRWLEQRLAPIGFRLVYCTRTPESFEAARAERLKVSGKPSQYDDLSIFVEEQKLMDRLVGESILPTLRLDVSDNDVGAAAERIADWLEDTGGLYADY